MQRGLIFNVQKYSIHDGPGIRTTVFLKGCPLHCAWCHNPESISPRQEIMVVEQRCIGCSECRRACSHGLELPGDGPLPPRAEVCELCGACIGACPTEARQMVGRDLTVDEVLELVLQDRIFYEDSGGGVTFSGGEPLCQPEFLGALLQACRARGLHTAVDTCGMAQRQHLLAVAPVTSLFLYDIKFIDDARHQHYTGASNSVILENLQALAKVHREIWLRVPVIPGINDDEAGLEAIARFAAGIAAIRQVNLLPFHQTSLPKARRLGHVSSVSGVQPPSAEAMERAATIFKNHGLIAKVGG
jgi:pyruvate formate lyase activating enzyme